MSAIHGLTPAPLQTPEPLISAVTPAPPRKPASLRVWVLLALVLGGAWAAYQFIAKPKARSRSAQNAALRTAQVSSGTIQRAIRLTGPTPAKNLDSVAAPGTRGPDAGRALV